MAQISRVFLYVVYSRYVIETTRYVGCTFESWTGEREDLMGCCSGRVFWVEGHDEKARSCVRHEQELQGSTVDSLKSAELVAFVVRAVLLDCSVP